MRETFDMDEAHERAAAILRSPPVLGRIKRPKPVGRLVVSFVIPLEMLKRQNWSRHQPMGVLARAKDELYDLMRGQCEKPARPLQGRPMVRCIRFSSKAPDRGADTFKMAIDMLCVPMPGKHRRLGFIVDDNDEVSDVNQHWEPVRPGKGFGLLELYTGSQPCRFKGCTAEAFQWLGWNAKPSGPPDWVRGAFCREHSDRVRAKRNAKVLKLCEGAML